MKHHSPFTIYKAEFRGGRSVQRGAFTLVEMLVAMVLTLILTYAIAEFYAYVGETIKDGRAMIALSSQMRGAVQRLKTDLEFVTCPLTPGIDDGAGHGYFEIAEGVGKDWDTYNKYGVGPPPAVLPMWESLYGDVDDVIAFTARSKSEPWVGQVPQVNTSTGILVLNGTEPATSAGNSFLAEIVWWTNFVDSPLNTPMGGWSFDEPRVLQRRQLLVRPDLNVIYTGATPAYDKPYYFRVSTGTFSGYTLMQYGDVSIRLLESAVGGFDYYVANSLSDLARRENRFMHRPEPGSGTNVFPVYLDLNPYSRGGSTSPAREHVSNDYSQYRWVLDNDRRGEDVILSNLLAFDVRVFDPTAPLVADNTNVTVAANALSALQPGDAGWNAAVTTANGYALVGSGAYVDLGYDRYRTVDVFGGASPTTRFPWGAIPANYIASPNPTSQLSGPMHRKSQLWNNFPENNPSGSEARRLYTTGTPPSINPVMYVYYDTWAQSYERDGINQNNNFDSSSNPLIDEGTDGIDTIESGFTVARNGVDDVNERETEPPYAYPLRGVEITIRTYEPGTRQVRQSTVGQDFIPD